MFSETDFPHPSDCDNTYFEFGDPQSFVTLINNTNTSLTEWVHEQSSSSLLSDSPGQSVQSTNYSSDSSPLAEITLLAEQLSSDRTELWEKPQENFEFYADDMRLQQVNELHGPVETQLDLRQTMCYCGAGIPQISPTPPAHHQHYPYYTCCSHPNPFSAPYPVTERIACGKTYSEVQTLPSVQTLTGPWSHDHFSHSNYATIQDEEQRNQVTQVQVQPSTTMSYLQYGEPPPQADLSINRTSSNYEPCGNLETLCYSSMESNLSQPFQNLECSSEADKSAKDHPFQFKCYTLVRPNNNEFYQNSSDHLNEPEKKLRSSGTRSKYSTQIGGSVTSGHVAVDGTEAKNVSNVHDSISELEPVESVVAAASAALANFHHRGSLQLWQFLVALLDDAKSQHLICWTGRTLEFKLNEPEEVARLWGIQKNRPAMNYDKLSRSLRYYYEKGIMQKVSGERYVYRFVYEPELLFALAFPGEDQGQLNRSDSSIDVEQFSAMSPPTDNSGPNKDWGDQRRKEDKRYGPAFTETKPITQEKITTTVTSETDLNNPLPGKCNTPSSVTDVTVHYYNPITSPFSSRTSLIYESFGTNELKPSEVISANTLAPQNNVDNVEISDLTEQNQLPLGQPTTSQSDVTVFHSDSHWYDYTVDTQMNDSRSNHVQEYSGASGPTLTTSWSGTSITQMPTSKTGHRHQHHIHDSVNWLDSWTTDNSRAMLHTPPVSGFFPVSESYQVTLPDQSIVTLLPHESYTQLSEPDCAISPPSCSFLDSSSTLTHENQIDLVPADWAQNFTLSQDYNEQTNWDLDTLSLKRDGLDTQSPRCFYEQVKCPMLYSKQG
ncbi:hypothetical protein FGIG_06987 [Fasciola gigantica]|uniref:ETS domain-containing protein n=1 Tax=Fasciola gigantica TaxID=46835 RepID=A0A504YAD8_FASGI|nr:hypothetical protein FGIG_06987 [Fasciola gigantica]